MYSSPVNRAHHVKHCAFELRVQIISSSAEDLSSVGTAIQLLERVQHKWLWGL